MISQALPYIYNRRGMIQRSEVGRRTFATSAEGRTGRGEANPSFGGSEESLGPSFRFGESYSSERRGLPSGLEDQRLLLVGRQLGEAGSGPGGRARGQAGLRSLCYLLFRIFSDLNRRKRR